MSANAVFRFLFGQLASGGFAYETLSGRGIGFEQRQSRLWLICHDGTTLTQFDTGINGATSDYSGNPADIILRSDGAGTLAISVVVAGGAASTASTGGAPTSVNTNAPSQPYAALTNGGDTTNCQICFFPHQFTDA